MVKIFDFSKESSLLYISVMFQIQDTIAATLKIIPKVPNLLAEEYNYESFYSAKEYHSFLGEFAQCGILNAIPIARVNGNSVGIRLVPANETSQIGCMLLAEHSEAMSLTTNLGLLAPSLLCYQGFIEYFEEYGKEQFVKALHRDRNLGDLNPSFREFLEILISNKFSSDYYERRGELWWHLGNYYSDDFLKFLGNCWIKSTANIDPKELVHHSSVAPWIQYRRLFDPWSNKLNEIEYVTIAKEILNSDDIFDASYSAFGVANSPGNMRSRPIMAVANWIDENLDRLRDVLDSNEMKLANALNESGEGYDGSVHEEIADELSYSSPQTAFVHYCNASAYWAKTNGRINEGIFSKLIELTKNNNWAQLNTYYNWIAKVI